MPAENLVLLLVSYRTLGRTTQLIRPGPIADKLSEFFYPVLSNGVGWGGVGGEEEELG